MIVSAACWRCCARRADGKSAACRDEMNEDSPLLSFFFDDDDEASKNGTADPAIRAAFCTAAVHPTAANVSIPAAAESSARAASSSATSTATTMSLFLNSEGLEAMAGVASTMCSFNPGSLHVNRS